LSRVETIAEGVTLYLGDCREILSTLGKVDAVVTDPPYGVGFRYESHDDTPKGYVQWCADWFALTQAATDGPIAISCGIVNVTDWPKPDWIFCWHKPASMGRCAVGFNNWEPVLLYGKSRAGQVVDVFRAPILTSDDVEGHPCPKPVAWGRGIIERISAPGDIILDPFTGSGTTGIAAVSSGRKFTGIEIEPKYFDIARRRIEQATKQADLFIEKPKPAEQIRLLP
jgi:DNA modification methylase